MWLVTRRGGFKITNFLNLRRPFLNQFVVYCPHRVFKKCKMPPGGSEDCTGGVNYTTTIFRTMGVIGCFWCPFS